MLEFGFGHVLQKLLCSTVVYNIRGILGPMMKVFRHNLCYIVVGMR